MKKILFFAAFAVMLITGASLTSCNKASDKLQELKGVVVSLDANRGIDTIRSMKVLADSDTLVFTVFTADYPNGIMIPGDSVDINYKNDGSDTLRAMIVTVKTKPSKEVDLDTLKDKPILTR